MSGKTAEQRGTERPDATLAARDSSLRKASWHRSAAALLEVVDLGGGCAADLAEALLEQGAGHDRVLLLAAALRASKRRREDEQAPDMLQALSQRSHARIRSKELMAVVNCAGGSEVAVLAMLMRLGATASNVMLLGGSGASSEEAPSGAAVADSVPVVEPAHAATSGADGAGSGGLCRVCCSKTRAAGAAKACADCDALVRRLRKQSGGVCKRGHVRAARAELGSDAPVTAVEQLARQLAGTLAPGSEAGRAAGAPGSDGAAAAAEAAADTSGATGENTTGGAPAGSSGGSARRGTAGGEAAWPVTPPSKKKAKLSGGRSSGPPSATAFLGAHGGGRLQEQRGGHAQQAAAAPASTPVAAAAPSALTSARQPSAGASPAGSASPARLCPICHGRHCIGKKSYCNPCTSMISAFRGKGKVQIMREAFRVLGSGAVRADVIAYVRRKMAPSEETVSNGEAI